MRVFYVPAQYQKSALSQPCRIIEYRLRKRFCSMYSESSPCLGCMAAAVQPNYACGTFRKNATVWGGRLSKRFCLHFSESSSCSAWAAWQLQFSPTAYGTLRKHLTKPFTQPAAPHCTLVHYLYVTPSDPQTSLRMCGQCWLQEPPLSAITQR